MVTTKPRKLIAAVSVAAIASLPLAACGSDSEQVSSPTSNSQAGAGSSIPTPVARINALSGESTAITLDQGFADALTGLGLTPAPVGTATLADGAISFPITGGNVSVFKKTEVKPYVIGQVQHEGSGLSLTAGGTTVELTNLNVDPGISRVYGDVTVNGQVAATSAFLFQLRGATLKPLQVEGDTAVLEGTKVFVSPVAAELLNQTFGTDAVTDALLVGIAKITVNTTPAA